MAEYIEREAFLAEQRHLYCENCERRKGMKNGKMRFVYGIGDAPCRSCGIGDVLDDVENFPAADVRPVMRGKWRFEKGDGETCVDGWVCSACNCGFHTNVPYFEDFNFCPNCGADMMEES